MFIIHYYQIEPQLILLHSNLYNHIANQYIPNTPFYKEVSTDRLFLCLEMLSIITKSHQMPNGAFISTQNEGY